MVTALRREAGAEVSRDECAPGQQGGNHARIALGRIGVRLTRAEPTTEEQGQTCGQKFANATDAAWAKTKSGATALAWQALGNVALARKKTDEAVADYQKGLDANPDPTESEARYWLAGNLCRCTGYDKVIRAVMDAAAELRQVRV